MKRHFTTQTLQVTALPGWLNRGQQRILGFLQVEHRMLVEQLLDRCVRLTDFQQRRLTAKAKAIGRRLLGDFATIVAPGTLLGWHRWPSAQKRTNQAGTGRPGVMKVIDELAVRMAKENTSWGYRRIEGALGDIGERVAHKTVKRILMSHGIKPAPERSKRRCCMNHPGQPSNADRSPDQARRLNHVHETLPCPSTVQVQVSRVQLRRA